MSDMARDLSTQAGSVEMALATRIAETDEVRQRMEKELLKVWYMKTVGSQINNAV
jgi:hypothetical protein